MPNAEQLKAALVAGRYAEAFRMLYPGAPDAAPRYVALIDTFVQTYGDGDLYLFSAPGRTEIGGNHTDHQHGRVLAAAVDLDMIAVARQRTGDRVRICSRGHGEIDITLDSLDPVRSERETSAALVRGMAAGFSRLGMPVCGFDACIDSRVYPGSGLSSSAAFETLVGVIFREFNAGDGDGGEIDAVEIAKMSQQAENHWFGKPSGLMDQMACAVGGLVAIDFKDPDIAKVERIDFDFSASGHVLCITGPIGSHADLTEAYAAVPREMRMVAGALGREYLREVSPPGDFYAALPSLLEKCSDRAVLRAMHFFAENERVPRQAEALRSGDFSTFLSLVSESGRSSFQYLQNVCHESGQRLAIALAESERILNGAGALRVHGGGFAGTILAFVPDSGIAAYSEAMNRIFGKNACKALSIRPVGATIIKDEVIA